MKLTNRWELYSLFLFHFLFFQAIVATTAGQLDIKLNKALYQSKVKKLVYESIVEFSVEEDLTKWTVPQIVGLASQAYNDMVTAFENDKKHPSLRLNKMPGAITIFTYNKRSAYFTSSAVGKGSLFYNNIRAAKEGEVKYEQGDLRDLGGKCGVVQQALMQCRTESLLDLASQYHHLALAIRCVC